jgi:hypothetical protein
MKNEEVLNGKGRLKEGEGRGEGKEQATTITA